MSTPTIPAPAEPASGAAQPRWFQRRLVRAASWALTAGAAAFTLVRLLGLEQGWLLVVAVAFTPYVALLAPLALAALAWARSWWALGVTLVCALSLAITVLPRAIGDSTPGGPADGPILRILSVNLAVGQAEEEAVIHMAREWDIDILSVQEVTPLSADRFQQLGVEELFAHSIVETGWAAEGSAIYSGYPLQRLPEVEPDGIFHQPAAKVDIGAGMTVNLMAVHAAAPRSAERIDNWERDFEQYPTGDEEEMWILAGDFNATLDHRNMRDLLNEGYLDAASVMGDGWKATWFTEGRFIKGLLRPPPVTLDRIVIDERAEVQDFRVLPDIGSDHRPVYAQIRLP
ncbi:endonuclease/exonuclease/phosphatase family protein [Natronoglycomyces albus]|uniref:Endonuclease/exonuclease/phosphatase family protein n=1 Tax=Natronoglycomyces albus TaxID=2811108 RepID=A0A895XPY9_9ACTN|nr:endonuclease/exonuclease/phosphatase family protein [Natronoglycomyces albus]QSB04606.1 endonuclease/exonuclease/phosphatase family protein [Natronoglycomyces albus]